MPDPASLRDSTQIVLPCETLAGVREDLERECTVSVVREDACRVIGSPVEIKKAGEVLARNGVAVR